MGTSTDLDPFLTLLQEPLERLSGQFSSLPPFPSPLDSPAERDAIGSVLGEVATRLGDNYPYFHPLYAGQMLKPPHPIARAAYTLAMTINPNNHARDGGRASSEMEIEAVSEIAKMFGWVKAESDASTTAAPYLGHLTSSGTFANLEALWVAGQLAPGKRIIAQKNAHYTHQRISAVLKIPFTTIPSDRSGRMDLEALESELRRGDAGTVVVTMGSTALGSVDPLPAIISLRDKYPFRIHLDAAYGGYFRLIASDLDEPAKSAFQAMQQADSIVVDPHKHGLQPYGCGCILFRDPAVGRLYKHDSPYTYFSSKQLHLGEISLECSRAGASAVALWATQRLLPLTPNGSFADGLKASRKAALDLSQRLNSDDRFRAFATGPELDIVVWRIGNKSAEISSDLAQRVFARCAESDLHLALVQLPGAFLSHSLAAEDETVTCLRSVLMKPQHADWMDKIWDRLDSATRIELAR